MKAFAIWISIMLLLASLILLSATGCSAPRAAARPVPPPVLTHPGQTPASLKHVAVGLDWIIVIAVLGVGAGIGLLLFAPVAHNISFSLAGTSAAIEGAALLTRVSLWFIPWIAIGLLGLAVLAAGYEIYRNRKRLFGEDAPPLPLTSTAPFPVQITHT